MSGISSHRTSISRVLQTGLVACCLALALLTTSAFSQDAQPSDEILAEFDRLLADANNGGIDEKLALFSFTSSNSSILEDHAAMALEHLAEASNLGSGQASYWIAQLTEHGMWIEKSAEGARIYYILSAQQGYPKAMLWCVLNFAADARDADSADEKAVLLSNASRWYEKFSQFEGVSTEDLNRARFAYSIARLSASSADDYGWTLLGEAAVNGHTRAVAMVRDYYSRAQAEKDKGDEFAAKLLIQLQPAIDEIGLQE